MKILMLVPYLPTITMSGGQTRWYNIIKYLAKHHEITLFSLIKNDSELELIPELEKFCKEVKVFRRPKKPWTVRNIFLSVFGPYPLLVIRNQSFEERRAIKKELDEKKYDLIHAETFYVMPHLGKTKIPTILVEQTVWHNVYRHYVQNEVPWILRPFYFFDVLKIKMWEKYYWSLADKLFAVSDEDRQEMIRLVPKKEVGIIPNGVDMELYTSKKVEKNIPQRILYGVTNFEWLQNQEATQVLVNEVWPEIKKQNSKVKLWIVGRAIPDWIKKFGEDKRIIITENIPDARDAYLSATIMVAPIRGSGGTRLKILEAMAAGLPVVSTRVGVAGLNVENGKNALIADTSRGLAKKALKLLNNKHFADKIGAAGQKHVSTHYDWESIVKKHDTIYQSIVK